MTKDDVKWQIPIKNKGGGGDDWVHPKSRPHAYIEFNNECQCLCGKYTFYKGYDCLESNPKSAFYVKPTKENFCNKCLKELEKLGVYYD